MSLSAGRLRNNGTGKEVVINRRISNHLSITDFYNLAHTTRVVGFAIQLSRGVDTQVFRWRESDREAI